MTHYIKADGLVFPYTDRDLKRDNRNTSFPAVLTDEVRASVGVYPVTVVEKPPYDPDTQVITQDQPQEVGGVWSVGWTVRNKTAEELAAEAARAAERDAQRVTRIKEAFDDQSSVNKVLLKICFLQENKIRVLEGKQPITAQQFRTWVDGQVD
jgi:hypothetical protein